MKLYMVPLAPNPTKVMLYIAERADLGCEMAIEQIMVNTLKGHHRAPEHLARNPFGTLPVLELDDGTFIRESLAIIEYLEDRFPEGSLLGDDMQGRAQARDVERIIDLRIAIPMARYAHATKSPLGLPPNQALAGEMESGMQAPLDFLEAQLSDGRPLIMGDRVSVADCTMQAALQFLRFIDADLMGERPNLRAWDARYRTRKAATDVLKW
jgi:glutathione S-transferase